MQKDHSEEGLSALVRAFMPYIQKRAARVRLVGLESDDIVQEGLVGLCDAVDRYAPERGASFATFAYLCIDHRIDAALRQQARKKNIPLNSYLSLSEPGAAHRQASDPSLEDMVILREEYHAILSSIERNLSAFERDVLALYLEGYSYLAISELLSTSAKSIDNALQRARRKLKQDSD